MRRSNVSLGGDLNFTRSREEYGWIQLGQTLVAELFIKKIGGGELRGCHRTLFSFCLPDE